ncbi:hypothetical protein [Rhodopila sp.]|uniref:hypothetical protein n=1 Tax=Rhodopila sp. TaxID=2480087 RepID=UPI003D0D0A3E
MAAYSVVVDDSGGFAVQIRSEGLTEEVGGFKTEEEAKEWMAAKLRADDPGNDFA